MSAEVIYNHEKFMDRWGKIYVQKYRKEGAEKTTKWFVALFPDLRILKQLQPFINKWKKFIPENNDGGNKSG